MFSLQARGFAADEPRSVTGVMPGQIALIGVPVNSCGTVDGVAGHRRRCVGGAWQQH